MKPRITLNTFRRIRRAEEDAIRAVMPRTSAADSTPLEPFGGRMNIEVVARRAGANLVRGPLTATLAERAR